MAWSLKQHKTAHSTDKNSFTSAAYDMTGADIFVGVITDDDGLSTLADSSGNTYNYGTAVGQFASTFAKLFWVIAPSVSAAQTFTLTGTAGNVYGFEIIARSGSHQTAPHDADTGSGYFAASVQPGSITPGQDNSWIFSGISQQNDNSGTLAINSGLTIQDYQPQLLGQCKSSGSADLIQNTAAAINPTWSWTGSDLGGCVLGVFKPAPPPPPDLNALVGEPITGSSPIDGGLR